VASATPVTTATAPGAVQNLVAKNDVYSIQLNWTRPANNGSTPVRFYLVTSPGIVIFGIPTTTETWLPASVTGFKDDSANPGNTYNYTVRAISSTYGLVNDSVDNFFVGGTGNVPSAPTNLTAFGTNSNVTLVWENPVNPTAHGLTNYTVLRSDSPTGPFAYIGNTSVVTSIFGINITIYLPIYLDKNLVNGHKYYYQVVANYLTFASVPSNIANATPTYTPPTITAAAIPGNGQILVVWSNFLFASNTTGFDIFRSTTAGTLGTLVNTSAGDNGYFWYDNTTTNGVPYYYTVRGNLSGVYVMSNQATATPLVGALPAAPTNLIATPDSSGVDLSADIGTPAYPILGYSVYRATGNGLEEAIPIENISVIDSLYQGHIATGLQSAFDSSAVDDVNYTYTITVKNMFGESAHSNKATSFASATGDAPEPVSDLAAAAGNNQVTLTWNKPTYQGTANVLQYEVFRNNGTGWVPVNFSFAAGLGQRTYVDTGLEANKAYQYYVVTSNNYGTESAPSNTAQATTGGSNNNPTAPTAPLSLTATASAGQIALGWAAPSSNGGAAITAYNIYRGTAAGAESTTAIGTSTSLTYTDSTVVSGQVYYYVIKAVNSAGVGAASNEASATAVAVVGAPGAPTGIKSVTGNGYVLLNWTAPTNVGTGITHYRVFRGISANGESSTPIAELNGTTLSYNDTTVTNNVRYYYIVKAVNAAGASDPSSEVAITANVQGSGTSSSDNTLLYAGVAGVVVVAAAAGGYLFLRKKK
jgi:titin